MRYAKDLKPGDLIVVAYGTRLRHAVYSGHGSRGNIQFYLLPYYAVAVKDWQKDYIIQRLESGKKPYKNYIIGTGEQRIARLDISQMKDEDIDAYVGIVMALKTKGYIQ